jgi:hypothetical protein
VKSHKAVQHTQEQEQERTEGSVRESQESNMYISHLCCPVPRRGGTSQAWPRANGNAKGAPCFRYRLPLRPRARASSRAHNHDHACTIAVLSTPPRILQEPRFVTAAQPRRLPRCPNGLSPLMAWLMPCRRLPGHTARRAIMPSTRAALTRSPHSPQPSLTAPLRRANHLALRPGRPRAPWPRCSGRPGAQEV